LSNTFDKNWTPDEIMTIVAARQFRNKATCFIGVGQPSVAACVARSMTAPDVVLIYESGAIGAKPTMPPLSIADSELAETADLLVSMPELFSYWIQGGRIDMAFLGTAQIDRFGNLNTTVIGNYSNPKIRLPGGGGAPEIASSSREIVVIVRHTPKAFVEKVDFITTVGKGRNITAVITDLGILRPEPETGELTLISRHPGVSVDEIRKSTGWPLKIAETLVETPAPTMAELKTLRDFEGRTLKAAA
jgi:glutaconate CoA-transferase subunit B